MTLCDSGIELWDCVVVEISDRGNGVLLDNWTVDILNINYYGKNSIPIMFYYRLDLDSSQKLFPNSAVAWLINQNLAFKIIFWNSQNWY